MRDNWVRPVTVASRTCRFFFGFSDFSGFAVVFTSLSSAVVFISEGFIKHSLPFQNTADITYAASANPIRDKPHQPRPASLATTSSNNAAKR